MPAPVVAAAPRPGGRDRTRPRGIPYCPNDGLRTPQEPASARSARRTCWPPARTAVQRSEPPMSPATDAAPRPGPRRSASSPEPSRLRRRTLMERRELAIETGHEPAVIDLTDACARFLAEVDGGRRPPHRLRPARHRRGCCRGARRRLRRRPARDARPSPASRRPVAPSPWESGPRCRPRAPPPRAAVGRHPGRRRPDGARVMAVGRPRRPEPGQRPAHGAPLVPPGLTVSAAG